MAFSPQEVRKKSEESPWMDGRKTRTKAREEYEVMKAEASSNREGIRSLAKNTMKL